MKTLNFKTQYECRIEHMEFSVCCVLLMGPPYICRLPISRVRSNTSTQLISQPVPTQYQNYHVQHGFVVAYRSVNDNSGSLKILSEVDSWRACHKKITLKDSNSPSLFSHVLKHLEYRRAFCMYVRRQTKCCTDFYLLEIGKSFVVFRCPRDTLQSGADRYQGSTKIYKEELEKCLKIM